MSGALLCLICSVIGYLLGSISSGVLISRCLGGDIRTSGSKNPGASNMLRVYGKLPGVMTYLGDCLKAVIAVLLGKLLFGQLGAIHAGFFAIVGHNWPLYFRFRGGKGIACATGVFMLIFPLPGLIAVLLDVITVYITRFISLGSIVLVVSFAIIVSILHGMIPAGLWAVLIALLSIYRHHENIDRLLHGTERKIGQRENH